MTQSLVNHLPSSKTAPREPAKQAGHSSTLFDDDPGIMSEVETSATGFRRGSKTRSSLPIVRTPSKTQDRSLGLVFLQYRNETKRALLPNEITSMDTVKALFVRSFPRQLTMPYLDSRQVRIYAHDPNKDMFYELEDLRDVRDRTVLRIYEQDGDNGWQPVGGVRPEHPAPLRLHHAPPAYLDDPSYFSEPEFDSERQHIHRRREQPPANGAQSQYYGTIILPPAYRAQTMGRGAAGPPQPPERQRQMPPAGSAGFTQTLPRGMNLATYTMSAAPKQPQPQRSVSPDLVKRGSKEHVIMASQQPGAPPKPQRSFQALIGAGGRPAGPPGPAGRAPPGVMSPQSPQHFRPLPDRPYSVAGQHPHDRLRADYSGYLSSPERRHVAPPAYPGFPDDPYAIYGQRPASVMGMPGDEVARQRMESMERQIAQLTNVVERVLAPQVSSATRSGPTGSEKGK